METLVEMTWGKLCETEKGQRREKVQDLSAGSGYSVLHQDKRQV